MFNRNKEMICALSLCLLLFQTISSIVPDIVLVELCKGRVNILQLDEETLLHEAKNISIGLFYTRKLCEFHLKLDMGYTGSLLRPNL